MRIQFDFSMINSSASKYNGLRNFLLLGLFLILLNPIISASNNIKYQLKLKSVPESYFDRAENVRYSQSLDQTVEERLMSRQFNLLKFIQHAAQKSLQADFTFNNGVNHHDVFYYASQWQTQPSTFPHPVEIQWNIESGEWQFGSSITGNSRVESRLISSQAVPVSFSANISLILQEGISAGFMLWSDPSGQTGYVIRYDTDLKAIVLSRIGPHLEEIRFDTFPLIMDSNTTIDLSVETTPITIRAYLNDQFDLPVLETTNITPLGNHIGWYLYDAHAQFSLNSISFSNATDPVLFIPNEGDYQHIYDQSIGETEPWYINDHSFIQEPNGTWHLFGITNTASPIIPLDEDQFMHATASQLTQSPWQKQPFALQTDTSLGESQLWAPHVFFEDGLYYMFYCAGSQFSSLEYRMHLATSTDLFHWIRHETNPLFTDFYDARDPMILQYGDQYIMYYTANSDRNNGNHIVAYRTSSDLINWSTRKTAFTHSTTGNFGGPTESAFVVPFEGQYYLWIGPENLNTTPDEDYRRTAIYRSSNPYHWDMDDRITSVRSHAAEVVQTSDNQWYVSHCGWFYDGVYLSPFEWIQQPSVQLFTNLGESLDYVTDHFFARVSDWRGTGGLDIVADFGSYFDLKLPVDQNSTSITVEFEEEGETWLLLNTNDGFQTVINEGDTGPGSPQIHSVEISKDQIINSSIYLRFQDSDPTDGWGPNVNWIRILY